MLAQLNRTRLAHGLLGLLLFAFAAGRTLADDSGPPLSSDGMPQRLVLALDGIPYEVFADLQRQGHFADFKPAAKMVSTFPSLSDVAFAAIGGAEPPDGYQVMRFDPAQNKVVGNTIGSLGSRAHSRAWVDSPNHSSLHRMVGYMAAYSVALRDLRQIGQDFLLSDRQTYVGMLGQSDSVLHIDGRAGAEKLLLEVDAFLQDLQAQVRARTGRELLVDIVSDHGSTMVKGKIIPLDEQLRGCGFQRRDRIEDNHDIAYSLAGIIGSVAITTSPESTEAAARCLTAAEGVDLVAIDRGDAVGVMTADGEAQIRPAGSGDEAYEYRVLRGDPLQLAVPVNVGGVEIFDQASLFAESIDAARPDPLRRLWRAFHGEVKQPSPILVSLADGYEAANPELRALASLRGRFGTHGSMTRLASLGVLVSNWREVGDVNVQGANESLFGARTLGAMQQVLGDRTAATAPPELKGRSSP
jgi:hypothetical protein